MTISFNHKSKLNTVGTGSYVFRHYGIGGTAYYELDYIESNGCAYIDTGVSGGSVAEFEMKLNYGNTPNGSYPSFYGNPSDSSSLSSFLNYPYSQAVYIQANGNQASLGLNNSDLNDHILSYKNGRYYLDNAAKGSVWGNSTWGSSGSWHIFANNGLENKCTIFKLYYLKMWKDGLLVRDFKPVMRVSDFKVGLIDVITGEFYTPIGAGEFIPGIKINGYSQLGYIQSAGSSYIDTNVSGGNKAKYQIILNTMKLAARNYEQYIAGDATPLSSKIYLNRAAGATVIAQGPAGSSGITLFTDNNHIYTVNYNNEAQLIVDNGLKGTFPSNNGWGSLSYYVFNSHGEPTLMSVMKLYNLYMWTDDSMVRMYLPARRTSDNVVGLYDLINKTFVKSETNTNFTAGNVTVLDTGTDANIIYF